MKLSWHFLHLKTGVGGFGACFGFTGVGVLTAGGTGEAKLLGFTGFGRGLALLLVTKCLLAMCASNSALLTERVVKLLIMVKLISHLGKIILHLEQTICCAGCWGPGGPGGCFLLEEEITLEGKVTLPAGPGGGGPGGPLDPGPGGPGGPGGFLDARADAVDVEEEGVKRILVD